MLRHFSPQVEWKPEVENNVDHSVCKIQTIYLHIYYHVYSERQFTLMLEKVKDMQKFL